MVNNLADLIAALGAGGLIDCTGGYTMARDEALTRLNVAIAERCRGGGGGGGDAKGEFLLHVDCVAVPQALRARRINRRRRRWRSGGC
jgi:hypothetical protein